MAELAACGTPIGAPADGEPDGRRAHAALRQAYASGTMTDKVDDLLDAVGLPSARPTLGISVIMLDRGDPERALALLAPQQGLVQLVLLSQAEEAGAAEEAERRARAALGGHVGVVVRRADPGLTTGALLNRALDLCEGDLVAVMDARDSYGEHYLADLARVFTFTTADIAGKAAYHAHLRDVGATVLRRPDAEYAYLPEVAGATLLGRRTVLRSLGFADLSEGWDEVLMRQCRTDGIKVFSADRYGYVCLRDHDADLLGSARLVEYGPAEPHALV
jgi:hypothetical protein